MDTIFIENLSIAGKHGALPHEHAYEQEFLVDIRAQFDARESSKTDALEDTIDYDVFRNSARNILGSTSTYLIEKLAQDIADDILKDSRIKEVSVTIKKPKVFPSGVPGVTITRKNT